MTTYTWPSSDAAFRLASIAIKPLHNLRTAVSPLSGAIQSTSLPGQRWGATLSFPKQTYAERARVLGFFDRLNGQEHRLSLWDVARPSPSLLSGTPLVNGALAQFASSLSLDGVIFTGSSRIRFSQDIDNAWWVKSALGTGVAPVVVANDAAAPDGSITADKVTFDIGAGTTSGDRSDLSANGTDALSIVGVEQVAAVWIKSATASSYVVRFDFSGIGGGNVTVTPTWQRFVISVPGSSVLNTGTRPVLRLRGGLGTSASAEVHVWGMTFIRGTQSDPGYTGQPSLQPGDWLSLPLTAGGSQLVKVVNTTVGETLTGVEFRPMLRGAVADNAAITIVQPSALWVLADPSALDEVRNGSNICPEMSVELIEVFS